MFKKTFKTVLSGCCLILLGLAFAWTQDTPNRIEVMKEEIARNFEALQKEPVPPYYMSYSIDDVRIQSVAGSFGAAMNRADSKISCLRVEVRTGSYSLDSSHEIRGDSLSALRSRYGGSIQAPIEGPPDALRVILWRETDKAYKSAVESLARVKSQQSVMVAEEDKSDDFSRIEPQVVKQDPLETQADLDKWAERIRKFTEGFKEYPFILSSSASFRNEVRQKYFVNTEGASVSTPAVYMGLQITATAKADDGMELPLYLSYFGFRESDFPDLSRWEGRTGTRAGIQKSQHQHTQGYSGNIGQGCCL